MAPVTAVIFDIGNVLVRWDPRMLYEKLIADAAELDWFLDNVVTMEWHGHHDAGRPFAEGIAELTARYPEYEPLIRAFRERWDETFDGPIDGTVRLLKRLARKGVPLYALTNFSAETYPDFAAGFAAMRHFKDVLVSGRVGMVKPDPRIYRLAAERFDIAPADSLFIDDRVENVDAARAEGFRAHHFREPAALAADLSALRLI